MKFTEDISVKYWDLSSLGAYAFYPYHFTLIINKFLKLYAGKEENVVIGQGAQSWDFLGRNKLTFQDDLPHRVNLCSPVGCITSLLLPQLPLPVL